MSFRCQICGRALANGQTPVMVTIKERPRTYPPVFDPRTEKMGQGGQGYEIVEEKQCCYKCACLLGPAPVR